MATNSETGICNIALGKLGQRGIMSLDDESQAARVCSQFYAHTRDTVLQSEQWNFAMARLALPRLVEVPASGWAGQYQLPSDCLRVTEINDSDVTALAGRYAVEGDRLLTDEDRAVIRYVRRVTDPGFFDPLFVEALATRLAGSMARILTGSLSEAQGLLTEYARVSGPEARQANATEGRPKPVLPYRNSQLVRARFGG